MGTRSNTIIINAGKPLLNLYRQFDGYPAGHGDELANFLVGIKMVNGIGSETKSIANGAGCLAAQLVAHFKTAPGGFYIHSLDERDNDYTYLISCDTMRPGPITIEVLEWGKPIFIGSAAEFKAFCAKPRV